MAVSLPSDLVMDVMRNADPTRLAASRSKLMGQAAATESPDFSATLASRSDADPLRTIWNADASRKTREPDASAYAGFERMVLRNLFESMMPAEENGLMPEDPGNDVWRSMAADQYAGAAADAGGIGIARMLAAHEHSTGPTAEAQWPYFSVNGIKAYQS